MHETYVTDEIWDFDCRGCGHHWSIGYEVHHTQGFEDDELRLWYRRGLPALAPDAGVPCPRCDGLRAVPTRPPALISRRAVEPVESSDPGSL